MKNSAILTEQEIRDTTKRRMWIILPTITCAVGAVFLHFIGVGNFRKFLLSVAVAQFGEGVRNITPIVLILPAFAVFLLPMMVAEIYVKRYKIICASLLMDARDP